jgi:hypothetical protein
VRVIVSIAAVFATIEISPVSFGCCSATGALLSLTALARRPQGFIRQ